MPGPNGAPYVSVAQLGQYLPAATLNLATLAQQTQACIDATGTADEYLANRYAMPLLSWDSDLTRYTAFIAIYSLMSGPIGFAAQAGSDKSITKNYYAAIGGPDPDTGGKITGYFEKVQRQAIVPNVTASSTVGADPAHDAPQVVSQPVRGWQQVRRGRSVVGGF